MEAVTAWLRVSGVVLSIGGDPAKGVPPVFTVKLEKPQVIVDPTKNTITIIETK